MDAFKNLNPYFGRKGYWRDAIRFARYYHRLLPWLTLPHFTMSAIRSDKLNKLSIAIDDFAKALIDCKKRIINHARLKVEDFPVPMSLIPPFIMGSQVDIYNFADLLTKSSIKLIYPNLYRTASDVKTCLEEAILDEYHQMGHRNAHGLSIYFPYKGSINNPYNPLYSNCNLDFTEDTHWDEFLEVYLGVC